MAWVMFWTMPLPARGWAVQREMEWMRAGGTRWVGPELLGPEAPGAATVRGSSGKSQRVYWAAGSVAGAPWAIQSRAAKTTRWCAPLRSSQRRPRAGQKWTTQPEMAT